MNKSFPILSILFAIALFVTAFGALVVQAQPASRAVAKAAAYEAVLGKSLNDKEVADFIASNNIAVDCFWGVSSVNSPLEVTPKTLIPFLSRISVIAFLSCVMDRNTMASVGLKPSDILSCSAL